MDKKIVISAGLIGVLSLSVAGSLLLKNKDEQKHEYKPAEILTNEVSVEKDKDGKYIYDNEKLIEKETYNYFIDVLPYQEDQQENNCMKELVGKVKEAGTYTCKHNGYTYVAISYGKTNKRVSLTTGPMSIEEGKKVMSEYDKDVVVEKDPDKLIFRYRFLEYVDGEKTEGDSEKTVYSIFQLPTDLEVAFKPLKHIEEEIKFEEEKYTYKNTEGLPLYTPEKDPKKEINPFFEIVDLSKLEKVEPQVEEN